MVIHQVFFIYSFDAGERTAFDIYVDIEIGGMLRYAERHAHNSRAVCSTLHAELLACCSENGIALYSKVARANFNRRVFSGNRTAVYNHCTVLRMEYAGRIYAHSAIRHISIYIGVIEFYVGVVVQAVAYNAVSVSGNMGIVYYQRYGLKSSIIFSVRLGYVAHHKYTCRYVIYIFRGCNYFAIVDGKACGAGRICNSYLNGCTEAFNRNACNSYVCIVQRPESQRLFAYNLCAFNRREDIHIERLALFKPVYLQRCLAAYRTCNRLAVEVEIYRLVDYKRVVNFETYIQYNRFALFGKGYCLIGLRKRINLSAAFNVGKRYFFHGCECAVFSVVVEYEAFRKEIFGNSRIECTAADFIGNFRGIDIGKEAAIERTVCYSSSTVVVARAAVV